MRVGARRTTQEGERKFMSTSSILTDIGAMESKLYYGSVAGAYSASETAESISNHPVFKFILMAWLATVIGRLNTNLATMMSRIDGPPKTTPTAPSRETLLKAQEHFATLSTSVSNLIDLMERHDLANYWAFGVVTKVRDLRTHNERLIDLTDWLELVLHPDLYQENVQASRAEIARGECIETSTACLI